MIAQNPYEQSRAALKAMLKEQAPLSFKKAVFSIENAYFDNQLSEQAFDKNINFLLKLVKAKRKNLNYSDKDSEVLREQKDATFLVDDMNTLYATIHQLGYRTMPQQMYQNWMQSLHNEREKYRNKAVIQWDKN